METLVRSCQNARTTGLRFATLLVVFGLLLGPVACGAEEFEFAFDDLPASMYLDRWMYPFNVSPGTRIQAPTFGAVGSEGFDERDGQLVLAVNTAEFGIEPGLQPSQYRINSATLTLTETFGGYRYDPTYDSYTTYLDSRSALSKPDGDAGRPIELYGVGFRGDFTAFVFPDGISADPPGFGSASEFGGDGTSSRNVFAADASGQDVSNNVDALANGEDGFDPTPFAVAKMFLDEVELSPGDEVTARTSWVFEIDVENAAIQSYLANSLSAGQLGLTVSSMHETGVQGVGDPFPNPATSNHFAFDGPVLLLDVTAGLVDRCGDFDRDGDIDSADRTKQTVGWTGAIAGDSGGATFADGDCDADGDVDTADQTGLIQNWTGAKMSSQAAGLNSLAANSSEFQLAVSTVPEPNALQSMLGAAVVLLLSVSRRVAK